MKLIISKLFNENGFDNSSIKKHDFYKHKTIDEFFITQFLTISEFHEYQKDQWTQFVEPLKSKSPAIERNTSLLIFIKVNSFDDIKNDKIKHRIYTIEEDDCFFRKYVIIYTEAAVNGLNNITLDSKSLSDELENDNLREGDLSGFDRFRLDNYFNDKYCLIIQLFIKLPFLYYIPRSSEFMGIQGLLDSNLNENQKILKSKILKSKILKSKILDYDKVDDLEYKLLSEDEDKIDFLESFGDMLDE